jgi:tetratricopeptide (TPR) repeat protein
MIDRKTIDELLEQAYTFIQQGDADQAIKLGKQLLEHKHARGFEIIALAHEQQGRSGEAIDVLKDGVSKVPNAWPLWELLGNLYSDQDQHGAALDAYKKALACPNADASSINYNYTILLKRQGQFEDALKLCDNIVGEDLRYKVKVLRLSLYNCLSRWDEAVNYGKTLIAEIIGQKDIPDEDMQDLARAYAEVGRAQWEGRYDRQSAWENAWKALEWERSDNSALWLVREIIARKSAKSKWFKLIVEGRWHFPLEPDKPPPGFITTYEVVADTPEDALAFAQDLEPVEIRATMKLDSHEEMGSFPDNNQGVYWRSAYGFFLQ